MKEYTTWQPQINISKDNSTLNATQIVNYIDQKRFLKC